MQIRINHLRLLISTTLILTIASCGQANAQRSTEPEQIASADRSFARARGTPIEQTNRQLSNPLPSTPTADLDAPAIADQFVIKFTTQTTEAERRMTVAAIGGNLFRHVDALGLDGVAFPNLRQTTNSRARGTIIESLQHNPKVAYIEPNYLYQVSTTPNDPDIDQQYAWSTIQAYSAWDTTKGNTNTIIAVVDTGIQLNHPDLDAKIVAGYDFVDNDTVPDDGNGHGTHIGGTAAAETNNSVGGAGACPQCVLMPVRVLNADGSGSLLDVADGIVYAADHGAKVVNLSLGGSGSSALHAAVDYAWNKGVFLACAAGNNDSRRRVLAYPGAYPNCFAVAASTSADTRASFSNYGDWVEVAAPGENIRSTWIGSGYQTLSGTSMATPHVAGLAGLLAAQGLNNAQIRDRICTTADPISGTGSEWMCGRINAYRAVQSDQSSAAANTAPAIDQRASVVQNVTPVPQYEAAQLITSFANTYLGITPSVSRAGGVNGNVTLPLPAQAAMDAVIALSGQVVAGRITKNDEQGVAEVAVGNGTISGDIAADLNNASAGAYTLVTAAAPPADAPTALALLRSTYPALANIDLQQQTTARGGYLFSARTSQQVINPATRQVNVVAQGVLAGTNRQGRATVIWVVVGNGTFATSIVP